MAAAAAAVTQAGGGGERALRVHAEAGGDIGGELMANRISCKMAAPMARSAPAGSARRGGGGGGGAGVGQRA